MKNISKDVYILTSRDLDDIKQKSFQRGVERGKFEATMADKKIAMNCENWKDGRCEACGVQWQYFEVSKEHKCKHFSRREKTGQTQ